MSAATYQTPRALPPGTVQGGFAEPELWSIRNTRTASGTRPPVTLTHGASGYTLLPTSTYVRVGLGAGTELGLRTGQLGAIGGAELKVELVSGRTEIAVLPSAHVGEAGPIAALPVLVGWQTSSWSMLLLGAGLGLATTGMRRIGDGGPGDDVPSPRPQGALATASLAWRVQASQRFGLHPEIALVRTLGRDGTTLVSGGVGLIFGGGVL